MVKALFAGTFDPPTLGHLDIIRRAACFCSQLIVGVGNNDTKAPPLLTVDERVDALEQELASLPNVAVHAYSGLTVDFAKEHGVQVLLRGVRPDDFGYETERAQVNAHLGELETIFLPANYLISSSLIRELAVHGADFSSYVPKPLKEIIQHRLQKGT